ncbi:low-CO2-inducible protein [Haematococcus lacustris]
MSALRSARLGCAKSGTFRSTAPVPFYGSHSSHPPSFAIADSTKRYNSYVSTTQHNTTQHVAVPDVRRAPAAVKLLTERQQMSLPRRQRCVAEHFPSALGVDDFMARLEVALSGFGFTGENSIAITNLCRDEVTTVLKDKIEAVFGSSFNTNGLGAVLTCGVTGMGAGFSHSPVSNGKEHYVFFAFPHIGINSAGEVGAITRPGRSVKSCACGALQKCLIELKAEGYTKNCKTPGVHNPLDPEYSILKQRLARRVRYEGLQPSHMDLVTMTQVAERTITNDLMFLIEKMVDPTKANYAVVTGVQIHNWAAELSASSGVPSLEFVAPTDVLVMRHGTKFHINLAKVPTMSPRQLRLFANASTSDEERDVNVIIGKTIAGTLKEIPLDYLTRRLGVTFEEEDLDERDLDNDGEEEHAFDSMDHYSSNGQAGQAWQAGIIAEMAGMERDPAAPTMDSMDAGERYTSFTAHGGVAGFLGLNQGSVAWPPGI